MNIFQKFASQVLIFCILSTNMAIAQIKPIPMEIIDLKTKIDIAKLTSMKTGSVFDAKYFVAIK